MFIHLSDSLLPCQEKNRFQMKKNFVSIIYLINQYLKNNTVFRMQENAFDFSSQNNMNEYS
ncbi:MAG: hypothetical protein BWK80_49435 [Desulfobacteraceae bacterium IS3]|nr:MAG: hypothetical protein BWK80_49435 [Desulfobacteraceae bacterium IS3]